MNATVTVLRLGLFLFLLVAAGLSVPGFAASVADAAPVAASPISAASQQLLLVRSKSWSAIGATLERYERRDARHGWRRVGAPINVVIGGKGMAWGYGLSQPPLDSAGPVKHEGDGASPAGAFEFGTAFGYGTQASVGSIHVPYVQSLVALKCVDDITSSHYNQLVSADRVKDDWDSAEDMLRDDEAYRFGIVIAHNYAKQTRPGRGSCIFMHVWDGPDQPTVGCTAMPPADIRTVLGWLDAKRQPVLVQLPQAEYARLKAAWGLP